ncbi:MAG: AIR synthase related protein, partial [Thermoanaerobaculales bacterium]|nr:AIR synthase related protein [Thermoanaerobaculales bacterium]
MVRKFVSMTTLLPPGKVPWDVIADLGGGALPPEVRLGPAAGEDAALVTIGGELWAVASDPITFTARDAGRLSVIVNANDVAVRGARPSFFLAVGLIAPNEASEDRVHELLRQVRDACDEVGAVLIGGHTEVTPGLPHSIIVGTMLGRVEGRPLTTSGLRDGDLVGMTRSAGLEGTAILLADHGDRLRALHDGGVFDGAGEILDAGWLLVAHEALRAAACDGVSALHDVTEGGVGEALYEIAKASGLALEVDREHIPVRPETLAICADLGIDPLGLIGSGSLVLGCSREGAAEVESAFADMGIPFAWIGRARKSPAPSTTVPRFPRDEILKVHLIDGVRAVIFDMDGTLVDSTYDWPTFRRDLDITGASIIDELNGLPEPERSARWAELEAIEARATDSATVHSGAPELLGLLVEKGLATALVTNNNEANTRRLLDRFGLDFD